LAATLNGPAEVAVDASGVVFIADTGNHMIRSVTPDGTIHRVVGDGSAGSREGPAILARFRHPGVTLTSDGALLIPDVDNNRIRRYDPSADNTSTVAGGDNLPGDGGAATAAILVRPTGLAVDGEGRVFISEHDSHRVRRVNAGGTIATIVNQQGLNGSATDGTAAINSPLRMPTGLALGAAGELLIADAADHRLLAVDGNGVIRTVAGNGTAGFSGDNGPAANAMLNTPLRMTLAGDGSIYLADFNNHRIRRIDAGGTITTVAGTGVPGSAGDGGPAISAELLQPAGLTLDESGNLYIADFGNHRIRKIDAQGTITTVAGTGEPGGLGDGGGAGAAQLNGPTDVIVAADGGLVVVDQRNNKIRWIAPDPDGAISAASIITTVLGSGEPAFADGRGVQASLLIPTDVELIAAGELLIADRGNHRVRRATTADGCAGGGGSCRTAVDCDDGNRCTLDGCDASAGTCTHERLSADQCEPRCSALANGCIPGGGPRRFDCLAEAFVQAPSTLRNGVPAPVVRCQEGDPQCDFDASAEQCTFRAAWCLNQERAGCTASGVGRIAVASRARPVLMHALEKLTEDARQTGKTVAFEPALAEPDTCTELMSFTVRLKKNGRKPGKLRIKVTAATASRPRRRDVDQIRFVCLP
jgi:sugar lactone lactonase YvrE